VKEKINVSSVLAETIEPHDNAPIVEIENPVIDLGTKSENQISETLKIKNTGASDLIIQTFTTDNPAFVSELRKELKIKPGKTETVKYSAKNLAKGDNTAQIYLTTNAPEKSLLNFTVKIKIE
jgi:cytochrome c oxidase assembly protein Cox11